MANTTFSASELERVARQLRQVGSNDSFGLELRTQADALAKRLEELRTQANALEKRLEIELSYQQKYPERAISANALTRCLEIEECYATRRKELESQAEKVREKAFDARPEDAAQNRKLPAASAPSETFSKLHRALERAAAKGVNREVRNRLRDRLDVAIRRGTMRPSEIGTLRCKLAALKQENTRLTTSESGTMPEGLMDGKRSSGIFRLPAEKPGRRNGVTVPFKNGHADQTGRMSASSPSSAAPIERVLDVRVVYQASNPNLGHAFSGSRPVLVRRQ